MVRRPTLLLAATLAVASCKSGSTSKPPAPEAKATEGARGAPTTPPPPTTGGDTGAAPVASGGSTEPDPSFELTTEGAAAAAAAAGSARLVVHPAAGKKMNLDYPTGLVLEPPAGVTVAKPKLAATDAEKFDLHELSYSVALSAAAPGEYKVPGTFRFAVCDDSACYPKKRAVELTLKVQ